MAISRHFCVDYYILLLKHLSSICISLQTVSNTYHRPTRPIQGNASLILSLTDYKVLLCNLQPTTPENSAGKPLCLTISVLFFVYVHNKIRRTDSFTSYLKDEAQMAVLLYLFVFTNDLPFKGTRQTPTKLATANLSHTNIELSSMIMNITQIKKLWFIN